MAEEKKFEPKSESRLLLNEDLSVASAFYNLTKELSERNAALAEKYQAAFQAEWGEVQTAMLKEITALEKALFDSQGIHKDDPEWPMWKIDARYLAEHGIMFLVKDVDAYKTSQMVDASINGKTKH